MVDKWKKNLIEKQQENGKERLHFHTYSNMYFLVSHKRSWHSNISIVISPNPKPLKPFRF